MSNTTFVQQMYADFVQGNVPGVLSALSEDIIWDTNGPALVPYAGVKNGKAGAMEFFNQLGATTSFEKFEPHDFIEEGDKVIALGVAHFTTLSTGKKGVNNWAMAWTFKNGKVVQYKNYVDTYVIAETFK